MLKRKIYDQLLSWKKNSNGKTAVLIDGARRVGKSYISYGVRSIKQRFRLARSKNSLCFLSSLNKQCSYPSSFLSFCKSFDVLECP